MFSPATAGPFVHSQDIHEACRRCEGRNPDRSPLFCPELVVRYGEAGLVASRSRKPARERHDHGNLAANVMITSSGRYGARVRFRDHRVRGQTSAIMGWLAAQCQA
jgi:hypothetical protein